MNPKFDILKNKLELLDFRPEFLINFDVTTFVLICEILKPEKLLNHVSLLGENKFEKVDDLDLKKFVGGVVEEFYEPGEKALIPAHFVEVEKVFDLDTSSLVMLLDMIQF